MSAARGLAVWMTVRPAVNTSVVRAFVVLLTDTGLRENLAFGISEAHGQIDETAPPVVRA